MRRLARPYTLIMGSANYGIFKTLEIALAAARQVNTNRVRSSGGEDDPLPIKVYYEQVGEEQRLIHEE